MRDLYVKGHRVVVFPRFHGESREFVTHLDVLGSTGVSNAWLRDCAVGKLDDVLAAKVRFAEISIDLSEGCMP
jgi:hypothetical protein